MTGQDTRARIVIVAQQLMAMGGVSAVTFDGIAREIGHSKQAILYWFPNKRALLLALFLPWIQSEADCALEAISREVERAAAIQSFVHAIAAFHLPELERFRMMYLLPQFETTPTATAQLKPDNKVYEITNKLYEGVAAKLGTDAMNSRLDAFNLHAAVIGLITMIALTEALNDPLKQTHEDLVDRLALQLSLAA